NGIAVLRADYARGDATRSAEAGRTQWERDLIVRQEIGDWFTDTVGGHALLMAGICRGARVVIHLAAREKAVSSVLLIAPPVLEPVSRRRWLARHLKLRDEAAGLRIDPRAASDLIEVTERMPVTMICSDRDAAFLRESLGGRARDLDLISGPRLNRMESPEVQAAVRAQTVDWAW